MTMPVIRSDALHHPEQWPTIKLIVCMVGAVVSVGLLIAAGLELF